MRTEEVLKRLKEHYKERDRDYEKEKVLHNATQGTWFVAYGCVYSQLGDGTIVRVALMDRDEDGTMPTERDANCHLIVKLQNDHVRREIPLGERERIISDL